jgi:16S rRNA (guanine527-N7)-methyltransferase
VVRARAEESRGSVEVDVVTARAVAPLGRLAGWGLPLCRSGGMLLAMKGASAARELADAEATLTRLGVVRWRIVEVGDDVVDPPATVVQIVAGEMPGPLGTGRRR